MQSIAYESPLAIGLQDALAGAGSRVLLVDADVQLSGEECLRAAADLTVALAPLVPERGRVGVLLPPSAAQALAIVQVLLADRVPVVLDPWTAPALLADVCRRGRLHGLVASAASGPGPGAAASSSAVAAPPSRPADLAAEPPDGLPLLLVDRRGAVVEARPPDAGAGRAATPPLPPAGAALILNTSGSTGEPKAVVLPAAGLASIVEQLAGHFELGPSTVAAIVLPLHHTMALNTQFLPTLLAGGRSVFFDAGLALGRTWRDLLGSAATFVTLIGDMLRPCLREKLHRGLPAAGAVTQMQLSGGVVDGEHLAMARQLFPGARLHKGYGLTEAVRVAMIDSRHPRFGELSAGFPLAGQEVAVRDETGAPAAPGRRGEIYVRGPQVMVGYDGEGVQPFRDGFLETGDLGYLTVDGRLVVEGRRDGMFKSYGRRIAGAEIELAALRWPGVAAAKCLAVSCPERGMRPVLFVELDGGPRSLDDAARSAFEAAMRRSLAPFKVPREVVVVAAMPRSAVGKIETRELERCWHGGAGLAELGGGPAGCRFRALDPGPRAGTASGAGPTAPTAPIAPIAPTDQNDQADQDAAAAPLVLPRAAAAPTPG